MKLTRKLFAVCSITAGFFVLAVAQDQGTRITTDHELKQWFSQNRTDFDKLRVFSDTFEKANQVAERSVKEPGSIDPELQQAVKKLHIVELGVFVDGDVEIVVNKEGGSRAGFLYSPGWKNPRQKAPPYTVLESLGDDWYMFRRS